MAERWFVVGSSDLFRNRSRFRTQARPRWSSIISGISALCQDDGTGEIKKTGILKASKHNVGKLGFVRKPTTYRCVPKYGDARIL